jgi:oligoendopeptidase F
MTATARQLGFVVLSVFAGAIGLNAAAQTSTTSAALSADLSRHYFKTPNEEVEARAELNASLDHMARFRGHVHSADQLLGLLRSSDAEQKLFAKHEAYLHLRCALDRKDAACHDRQELISNDDARTAFLKPEILAIPEARLRRFVHEKPALAQYRYALADIRRDAPHLLSAPEQALLDQFQPQIADWQYDLYDQVTADSVFGTVQTPAGPLSVMRQRNLIAASPDARVREEGFRKRYAGFASQRDLIAFALVNMVRAQTLLAKAHHYSDAPSRKYDNLYFDPKATRDLLARMAQHGDVVKRYEHIRSQDFERAYHRPAHEWDLSAPEPGFTPPLTALPDARGVFHAAFAGLGQEYQAAFDALLDPSTGRADIRPGGAANRYTSGFSTGFPGTTGMLFYGRYDGTFKDLSVIAHEGGHATHRQLMNENGVLPDYARGPNFMFESFAEFNELVLADFMARHAAEATLQRYYREEWMGIKGLDAFYGAQDAVLEQEVYDGVSAGTIRNADDLDALSVKVDDQFSLFPPSTPETRTRWAMVDLMYEDPLYDVNYMYAGLLALKYYQLYSTRPEWFVPRYIALLKNGFTQPPADLLEQFLEIDLSGPELLRDDLDLLNRRLDELETNAAK